MASRKIYYVSYETGFLSIHSHEIIQNLIKSGATVDLFMATDVQPHFNMQSDCNVHRVPAIFGNILMNFGVFQILLCLFILGLIIRTGKPDMIYARQSFSGFPVIILARLLKITYFAEANGITAEDNSSLVSLKRRVKMSLENFCLKLADVIIVPSETLKQKILNRYRLPAKKIKCVQNGCNEILFSPQKKEPYFLAELGFDEQDFIVGFVGSMGKWQGIETLKDAIKSTVAMDNEIKFLIVGDYTKDSDIKKMRSGNGDGAKDFSEFIKSERLEEKVVYHNFVTYESSANFMNCCDLLVAPYIEAYREIGGGSPMKLYAYLACAKPVIISDLGEFTDSPALKEHNAAHSIAPDDSRALADAIIYLKKNRLLGDQYGKNGRSFAIGKRRWFDSASQILTILDQTKSSRPTRAFSK